MSLLGLTVTLTLFLGSPGWTLDVSPVFLAEVPLPGLTQAVALPHLIIARPSEYLSEGIIWLPEYELMLHEMKHVRQWEALGPVLPFAYIMTAGQAFEDYLGDEVMWVPPPDMQRCPLMRVSSESLSFLPCWRF